MPGPFHEVGIPLLCGLLLTFTEGAKISDYMSTCYPTNKTIYNNYEFDTRDGHRENLTSYAGKVLIVVNVATYWGYTEQYRDFNPLLDKYNDRGFTILAFPSNQFHLQEPGENSEILNGLKYVRPGGLWEPYATMKKFLESWKSTVWMLIRCSIFWRTHVHRQMFASGWGLTCFTIQSKPTTSRGILRNSWLIEKEGHDFAFILATGFTAKYLNPTFNFCWLKIRLELP